MFARNISGTNEKIAQPAIPSARCILGRSARRSHKYLYAYISQNARITSQMIERNALTVIMLAVYQYRV